MTLTIRSFLALLAAVWACVAMPAWSADNLDCIDSGYGTAEQARLDSFAVGFDVVVWGTQGPPADILEMLRAKAETCAKLHDWSVEAANYAIAFKMGRIGLAGMESNGTLSADHLTRLRSALLPSDVQKGKMLMGQMATAYHEGREMPLESPDMFIGRFIVRSGVPTELAWAAGAWASAVFGCERFAELFAAA